MDRRLTTGAALDDPRLAPYRQLGAPETLTAQGLFVVEGRMVVRRLVDDGHWRLQSLLVTPAAAAGLADVLPRVPADVPVFVVDQAAMNAIAGFQIHRGCLGLAYRPPRRVLSAEDVGTWRRLLVLERVTNPDNVGGLFRNAAAFGVDAVVLGPRCGDPLYRKAVRTSMGASLIVPFVDAGPWPIALTRLVTAGVRVLALTPASDATPLAGLAPRDGPVAVLVGDEGEGLSSEALAAATDRVRVPMTARIDSLNVATAAAIALYHIAIGSEDR